MRRGPRLELRREPQECALGSAPGPHRGRRRGTRLELRFELRREPPESAPGSEQTAGLTAARLKPQVPALSRRAPGALGPRLEPPRAWILPAG
jgi:hypothetical protein